jgi:hypothetical protein
VSFAIHERPLERRSPCAGIVARDVCRPFAAHLAQDGDVANDGRYPAGLSLQDGEAEALVLRGEGEDARALIRMDEFVLREPPTQRDLAEPAAIGDLGGDQLVPGRVNAHVSHEP